MFKYCQLKEKIQTIYFKLSRNTKFKILLAISQK